MKPGDNMVYDYYLYHLEDNEIRRCIYDNVFTMEKEMSEGNDDFVYNILIPNELKCKEVTFDQPKMNLATAEPFISDMIYKIMHYRYNDSYKIKAMFDDIGRIIMIGVKYRVKCI
jgi:hypothetical protein